MDELTNANMLRLVPDMFGLLSNHIRTGFGISDSIDLANTYRAPARPGRWSRIPFRAMCRRYRTT
jgi:hypothetical protein